MTTFTTEDRIIAEQNGSVTINVEPIPFAGMVTLTESAPKSKPAAWFYMRPGETGKFMCGDAEAMKGIEKDGWVTTPLYLHPTDLTDVEIYDVFKGCVFEGGFCKYEFARAILKKAGEK